MTHTKDWALGLIFGTVLFLGIVFFPDYSADIQPTTSHETTTVHHVSR